MVAAASATARTSSSLTPCADAPSWRYSVSSRCDTRSNPVTSAHWRSETSPPRRNQRSLARIASRAGSGARSIRSVWPSGRASASGACPASRRQWSSAASREPLAASNASTVRLHHEGARQDPRARPPGPARHLAVVPARRQDRRPGPQRRRQVDPAPHHGRARHPLQRRGLPGRGGVGRLPAAGAAARPGQGRPRQRRRGRRRDPGAARPLRRHQHEARRGDVARGDGEAARRAVAPPGSHRRDQRLGPRLAARDGHGLAAAAAAGRQAGDAVGRRAPPGRAVPAAAAVARPAAARRADQPPRRRIGGLARAVPQGLSGHGRRGHPRPLLPRQRRRLDPGARSRPRHSVSGQLHRLARTEAGPAGPGRKDREQAPADAAARARLDPDVAAGPPGQGQGPPQRLRAAARRGHRTRSSTGSRSTSRPVRAWATSWSRPAGSRRPTATTCCSTT